MPSAWRSRTIQTARSRTSSEYLSDFLIALSSQGKEPPGKPVRFSQPIKSVGYGEYKPRPASQDRNGSILKRGAGAPSTGVLVAHEIAMSGRRINCRYASTSNALLCRIAQFRP